MTFEKTEQAFKTEADDICAVQPPPDISPERLRGIIMRLFETPDGPALAAFLIEHKIQFTFSPHSDIAQYTYHLHPERDGWKQEAGSMHIEINPRQDDDLLLAAVLHEARHARQAAFDALRPNGNTSPFDLVWFNRFIEADAQSASVLATFEMKLNGDARAFDAGKTLEYKEMYEVAEAAYAKNPESLNDGRLRRMIFDSWFTPQAKAHYAHTMITSTFPRLMEEMAKLPAGTVMKTASVTVGDLERIAVCGGEKINYLTLPGFKPLDDDFYRKDFPLPLQEAVLGKLQENWTSAFRVAQTNAPRMAP